MSKQVLSQGYTHTVVVTLHPSPKPPPLSKFLHYLSPVTGLCTEEWQQKKQFMLTDINTLHNPQPSYNTCKHIPRNITNKHEVTFTVLICEHIFRAVQEIELPVTGGRKPPRLQTSSGATLYAARLPCMYHGE
jgi:hypothetical protein